MGLRPCDRSGSDDAPLPFVFGLQFYVAVFLGLRDVFLRFPLRPLGRPLVCLFFSGCPGLPSGGQVAATARCRPGGGPLGVPMVPFARLPRASPRRMDLHLPCGLVGDNAPLNYKDSTLSPHAQAHA